mgnify:CR=1 FL=1
METRLIVVINEDHTCKIGNAIYSWQFNGYSIDISVDDETWWLGVNATTGSTKSGEGTVVSLILNTEEATYSWSMDGY